MGSVAFLQQQIEEITLQIGQLIDKRRELFNELDGLEEKLMAEQLQKYNLTSTPDVLK